MCLACGPQKQRELSDVPDENIVNIAKLKIQKGECSRASPGPGICGVVEGQCGKDLTSFYHEEVVQIDDETKRLVVTNGIPSHSYHDYSGTGR